MAAACAERPPPMPLMRPADARGRSRVLPDGRSRRDRPLVEERRVVQLGQVPGLAMPIVGFTVARRGVGVKVAEPVLTGKDRGGFRFGKMSDAGMAIQHSQNNDALEQKSAVSTTGYRTVSNSQCPTGSVQTVSVQTSVFNRRCPTASVPPSPSRGQGPFGGCRV